MRNGRRVSVRDTFRGSLAAGLEQHDAETAEDPVECEVLGGHGVKSDVAEPFCLHFVLRGTHHARGDNVRAGSPVPDAMSSILSPGRAASASSKASPTGASCGRKRSNFSAMASQSG